MVERKSRLQPWRYILEVACQLAALGHPVTLLSDGDGPLPTEILKTQVKVWQISSVRNPVWKPNRTLLDAIHHIAPQILIWHVSLTSFLYQLVPNDLSVPIVGLFSSPIYQPQELLRLGTRKLLKGYYLSGVNLAASLAPNWLLRPLVSKKQITSLIVQTETTRRLLEQNGLWTKPIQVILPGIDKNWLEFDPQTITAVRSSLYFNKNDLVVLYFGSPAELRGLPTLLKAFVNARRRLQNLKLMILSRSQSTEWKREEHFIETFIHDNNIEREVNVINGFLEPGMLAEHVSAADIIALPFEMLTTDAPLSILEAMALGKPIVTTRVACLPELVSYGDGYLAEPGDVNSLSEAILRAAEKKLMHPNQILTKSEKGYIRSWQSMGVEWSNNLQSL